MKFAHYASGLPRSRVRMLDRIVAAFALAFVDWLAKRIEKGSTANDATQDVELLRRAGARLRQRMHKNHARP